MTSASFYLIASSSSAIYLATSSLAASCFLRLNSATLALYICSYYLCISIFILAWCSAYALYCFALFLVCWPINFAYLASSFLCINIASAIFDFSFCLSSLILAIRFRCSIWRYYSACRISNFYYSLSKFFCFNLWTSPARLLVSSIFFQVFISSYFNSAIRFAKS